MRALTSATVTATTGLLLLTFALGSASALADRDRGHGWGHRKHDRPNVSVNVNVGARPYYRDYSRGYSRDYARNYRPSQTWRSYAPSTSWGYGVGIGSFGYGSQVFINSFSNAVPRYDYYDRRPVVVEKNIYIERSTPERRVTTRSISSSTTSLLRDRYGRCYEREVDGFGNETRIELDPSECNF